MLYRYARVSTTDQDLAIQHATLTAAGCSEIRAEQVSGISREGRRELDALLTFLRKGDTLTLTRIDRLARSIGDLQDIMRALKAKGVALKATQQPIDTRTAAGKRSHASFAVSCRCLDILRWSARPIGWDIDTLDGGGLFAMSAC